MLHDAYVWLWLLTGMILILWEAVLPTGFFIIAGIAACVNSYLLYNGTLADYTLTAQMAAFGFVSTLGVVAVLLWGRFKVPSGEGAVSPAVSRINQTIGQAGPLFKDAVGDQCTVVLVDKLYRAQVSSPSAKPLQKGNMVKVVGIVGTRLMVVALNS